VQREQDLTGRLDGSLKIEGPPEGLAVRGKVVLNEGRLRLTSQRNPLFREIQVRQIATAPTTSLWPRLAPAGISRRTFACTTTTT
jgi:hypothetical protein